MLLTFLILHVSARRLQLKMTYLEEDLPQEYTLTRSYFDDDWKLASQDKDVLLRLLIQAVPAEKRLSQFTGWVSGPE